MVYLLQNDYIYGGSGEHRVKKGKIDRDYENKAFF